MTGYGFQFAGQSLVALPQGALWWPDRRWLVVADLHLGKSERMARRGGPLLPPYEVAETLARLQALIAVMQPSGVISLGDGFDDDAAGAALPDAVCDLLGQMARGRDWVWIGGNHDPAPVGDRLPGRSVARMAAGPWLRHAASPGQGPDISGHYHPCVRLAGQRRRAFLIGSQHLILPAFGAYTGGLMADDPALRHLVPAGIAVACGARAIALPVGVAPGLRPRVGRHRQD